MNTTRTGAVSAATAAKERADRSAAFPIALTFITFAFWSPAADDRRYTWATTQSRLGQYALDPDGYDGADAALFRAEYLHVHDVRELESAVA